MGLCSEHRRMSRFQNLSVSQIHVHAARQARIEASHRAHDVDPLESFRPVFFENWRILYGVLVGSRRSVNIARTGVPGCRRIRMIIRDLPIADHNMMRKHAANRFMEPARDRIVRHFE